MQQAAEITVQELETWEKGSYQLVDIRDAVSFSYGHLPDAVNITKEHLQQSYKTLLDKKVVVYCKKGQESAETAAWLCEREIEAYHLKGGYIAWILENVRMEEEDTFCRKAEYSLQKKFRKDIWCRFTRAIREYELVKQKDKIAVCISGGKDSMLMAKLFQELHRHRQVSFETVFLVMNPGYSAENMEIIQRNADKLHIPITVFETNIFESVYHVEKSPCYLCARMRRGYLYSKAKELGCNKIALGHHYDDVIETILMGMLYGAQIQTMMPKLHSSNFEGMELIRPMYLIREESIRAWRDYNHLGFIQCACRFTDTCTTCGNGSSDSKRQEVKNLIRQLKKGNPYVEGNIFKSVENVNVDTVVAYKKDGIKHHFLETYDQKAL